MGADGMSGKKLLLAILPIADVLFLPFAGAAALTLKLARRVGLQRLPWTRKLLYGIGLFPIRRHYYEPAFHPADMPDVAGKDRSLPGIDMKLPAQLALLQEILEMKAPAPFTDRPIADLDFYYENENFKSGDACAWWSMILRFQPRCIIEVGSGFSTRIARRAIDELPHGCRHICIEPYEQPWLERCGAEVIRQPVEQVDPAFFDQLGENDVLFIDSSHIQRPGGDVLFEYLQILPRLKKGVLVHIHDIFTPKDYLPEWLLDENKFWNEQYLLEAFLTLNEDFEVVLALNHLKHRHFDALKTAFPRLTADREPGSFYIRRVGN